jgi:hypothetical protein
MTTVQVQAAESELVLKINQGVPPDLQRRYHELIAKRWAETLSGDEYSELLRLTDQVEAIEVQRVEYLAELARLRKKSLTDVLTSMWVRCTHG